MFRLSEEITIPKARIKKILDDPEQLKLASNLRYVSDAEPGINRIRKGKIFEYLIGKQKVRARYVLERIKKLVIPPAWKQVWICRSELGHLQATGFDKRRRKQYRYHSLWTNLRNHTKFYHLHDFGKALPAIRKRVKKDLSKPGLPVEKVLATVICLMEQTSIRVGNNLYEKLYGSFGLTTLKDKHVKISGDKINFFFRGKKGVIHNISVRCKKLSKIVQMCRDIPGKELFQYVGEDGKPGKIDSGMVNDYLKRISGQDFSAKDFRTWTGSVQALVALRTMDDTTSNTATDNNIVKALNHVSRHLGNTRAVCRKYYVHPCIFKLYKEGKLKDYFTDANRSSITGSYQTEEKVLMQLLADERN